MYIRCSDGRGMVKRCPGNLHFNALFKRCDTPERALCNLDCPYPSGMFPIPGRCNMFHRCDGGEVTVQTCPKGLHFNARTLTCDWPTAAMCEMTCPSFDGYFPIQGDCSAYVVCSAGQPNLKKCPAGKHFNFDLKRCDPPEIAKCELECPVENGLFPIPGHCDSYLRCEGQNPHLDTCAPGLFFNHFTQMCDLPDNVQC
ncbi:peritrophin-1 [Anabrus simplex]|uniref:peritrophin-1 n=1 Tax=Anabrus simplex TaxID=316456 RepID=UPI0034DCF464